jgi:hypothetical protein
MFYLKAITRFLKDRGQFHTLFTVSYKKWDPHLGAEDPPTNLNYGTLTMSEYSRPLGGQNLHQIYILDM